MDAFHIKLKTEYQNVEDGKGNSKKKSSNNKITKNISKPVKENPRRIAKIKGSYITIFQWATCY